MDYSNMQNNPIPKNKALVSGSSILGILSLISAFTCLSGFSPIFAGLSIIFALLSKGKEATYEKKAKQGLIFSIISLVVSVVLSAIVLLVSFMTMFQYEPDELHDYLNEAYEETYGESFDELYEDLYGEDFNDVLEEMYGDM